MLPGRRDSDPQLHIASADDEPMTPQEERRQGVPDRRGGDPSQESRPAGVDWKLWIQLGAFLILLVTNLFSVARSQAAAELTAREVSEIRNQLKGIEHQLNAADKAGNTLEQQHAFLKQQFEEFKRETGSALEIQKTWIESTREKVFKLEAKNEKGN